MSINFQDLRSGLRLRGLVAASDVTVVAVDHVGPEIANVVVRDDKGQIDERLVTTADLTQVTLATKWHSNIGSDSRRPLSQHNFDMRAVTRGLHE